MMTSKKKKNEKKTRELKSKKKKRLKRPTEYTPIYLESALYSSPAQLPIQRNAVG
jgi:hypothetical protein